MAGSGEVWGPPILMQCFEVHNGVCQVCTIAPVLFNCISALSDNWQEQCSDFDIPMEVI